MGAPRAMAAARQASEHDCPVSRAKESEMQLAVFLAMGAPPQGGQGGGGSGAFLLNMVFLGVVFLIFYLLLIRPQQRRQKQHQQMIKALKKGDRILTSGGLFAQVLNVKEDRVVATIAENVKVEIARQYVAQLVAKD
jgi:preprotein translocase subunit YajC